MLLAGKKLLSEIEESLKSPGPSPWDSHERRRRITMGVPSGDSSMRILDVPLHLSVSVIKATIAEHERRLIELSQCAAVELTGTNGE